MSETDDGYECLYWNSHFILEKGADPFGSFENPDGLGPHNFCRSGENECMIFCLVAGVLQETKRKMETDLLSEQRVFTFHLIPSLKLPNFPNQQSFASANTLGLCKLVLHWGSRKCNILRTDIHICSLLTVSPFITKSHCHLLT